MRASRCSLLWAQVHVWMMIMMMMMVLCPQAGSLAFTPPGDEMREVASHCLLPRQLWVSNLSKVAMQWREVDSNPRTSGCKAQNIPLHHCVPCVDIKRKKLWCMNYCQLHHNFFSEAHNPSGWQKLGECYSGMASLCRQVVLLLLFYFDPQELSNPVLYCIVFKYLYSAPQQP